MPRVIENNASAAALGRGVGNEPYGGTDVGSGQVHHPALVHLSGRRSHGLSFNISTVGLQEQYVQPTPSVGAGLDARYSRSKVSALITNTAPQPCLSHVDSRCIPSLCPPVHRSQTEHSRWGRN